MLSQATKLLSIEIAKNIELHAVDGEFKIEVGEVSSESGKYSYDSFMSAIKLCEDKKADAVVTMPIHKEVNTLQKMPL